MKILNFFYISLLMISSFVLWIPAETTNVISDTVQQQEKPVSDSAFSLLMKIKEEGLSKEIVEKLSPEQLYNILKKSKTFGKAPKVPDVAIIVPLGLFLMIFLIVFITLFMHYRKSRLLHDTLRKMVDKGAEIPSELLLAPVQKKSDLRRGIIFGTVGIGISVFLIMVDGFKDGAWSMGLIPLLVGLGYIVLWKIENRAKTKDNRDT